jgi:hypothetical protein
LGFALVHLPYKGDWDALANPYRFQSGRPFLGESLPYLPLRFLGLVSTPVSAKAWSPVDAPGWASRADALIIGASSLRFGRRLQAAVACATLAAAATFAFLLLNRVFSPQFLLPVAALWVTSLLLQPISDVRGRLFLGFLAVAATANFAVWPLASTDRVTLQVVLFVASIGATLVALGFPRSSPDSAPGP